MGGQGETRNVREEEKGTEIKQERKKMWQREKKTQQKKKKKRRHLCDSCHTACECIIVQDVTPPQMHFRVRRRTRRIANSRHLVVSLLTAKRKTVGMASRSDRRVEQDKERKTERGQGRREWQISCWWLFTGYSPSPQKPEASTSFLIFSSLFIPLLPSVVNLSLLHNGALRRCGAVWGAGGGGMARWAAQGVMEKVGTVMEEKTERSW